MRILKQLVQEFKEDVLLINRPKQKNKWVEVVEEKIIFSNDRIQINNMRKHPNYYKVKYLMMNHVICNIDCMISTRQAEEVLGIGRSSINRQLNTLVQDGLLQKVKLSNSNRGIYYKILISKEDAILYKDTFTPSGRKKNKNIW